MVTHKIVARYKNGQRLRGQTVSFNPSSPIFHLMPLDKPDAKATSIDVGELKAVFFVKSFAGRMGKEDRNFFLPGHVYKGSEIEVQFNDGETLVGSTPSYMPSEQGFFLFPADPESNAIKVFIVNSSVKNVRLLAPERKSFATVRSGEVRRPQEPTAEGAARKPEGEPPQGWDWRGTLRRLLGRQ